MSRGRGRRRGRGRGARRDFWRAWHQERQRLWEQHDGPPPDLMQAWREFFHQHTGEWPEQHWAFGGRRFKPWHQGMDAFNPFVASMLSKGGGLLPLLVLDILSEAPCYGNEIMDRISDKTRGQWAANPGAIYPLMTQLEEEGLVEGRWDDPDKRTVRVYHLTEMGEEEVARMRSIVQPKIAETIEVLQALIDGWQDDQDQVL